MADGPARRHGPIRHCHGLAVDSYPAHLPPGRLEAFSLPFSSSGRLVRVPARSFEPLCLQCSPPSGMCFLAAA
jgi:hypothetical protein